MRILWHGVPPQFATGYGVQTGLFCQEMIVDGHEVVISPNVNNLPPHLFRGIPMLNQGPRGAMGNDFIDLHAQKYRPDVVISMMDTHIMDTRKFSVLPWIAWQVVDAEPLFPDIRIRANATKLNLAMSMFGRKVMEKANIPALYCPLAYNPDIYHPRPRKEAREWLRAQWDEDWADRPVVTMVGMNCGRPSRKNFGAAFKAFARMVELCAEFKDALLYVHSERTGLMTDGESLVQLSEMYGIADRVRFPNQYEYNMGALDSEYMAMIYSASDVLVMPSHCEGFGVPLIEAQACGLPVVTVAYSAMPELTFKGETVEDYLCYTIHPGREVAIVDGDSFWCTMACVLRTGMNDTKREAPKQVSDYEIGKVYKHYMAPILKMVQDNPSLLENKKGQGI